MPEFYDLCLRKTSEDMNEFSREIGWTATNCEFGTVFLDADNWGELKEKIGRNREKADVLVFKGGDEELNRKAASDTRIDIILHPEKGRKDSGIDHIIAEEASENSVAIGFDLQQILTRNKKRTHILRHWRRNLKLCQKFETPYIITTGAETKHGLRAPQDLKSIIDSLGFNGDKAVSEYPGKILERSKKVDKDNFVRPGVEITDE